MSKGSWKLTMVIFSFAEILVTKNCLVILLLLFNFLFLVNTIFYLTDNDWDISFDAVLYISISHVDHQQSCFWFKIVGFGNEDWKIFSNGMSYHMFDWRVMPFYYCDEWYHWFNGVINDDDDDDDDCWVCGLTMFK